MPGGTIAPPDSAPHLPQPAHRSLNARAACIQFARTAADVDTTTATLGQTRQVAAHAYGTPQLQALYDGPGQGRDPEQQDWQLHRARVSVTAVPLPGALNEPNDDGTETPRPGTPVSVTVTGRAHGTDGWTAPTASYRLDCLTVQDPVAGWLVDDVAATTLTPTAAG